MIDARALFPVAAALAVTALSTYVLARAAPRLHWLDRARPGEERRKLQARAVPPVGGTALLAGLAAGTALAHALGTEATRAWPGTWPAGWTVWGALLVAWATGTVDDLAPRGLAPATKLVGIALATGLLCGPALANAQAGEAGTAVLAVLATLFLANAFAVFDHADGTAAGTALIGTAIAGAGAAGALCGFLPHNLVYPRDDGAGRSAAETSTAHRAPRAYLGDAGSLLLAFLLLATPGARGALLLPALDFARVILVRVRAGRRPWTGDRLHLAHRLQRAGLAPRVVALVVVLAALPGTWLGRAGLTPDGAPGLGRAALVELGVYAVLILATRRWAAEEPR